MRIAVIVALLCAGLSAQTTWVVSASATGPGTGSAVSPFPTIQAAVNAASSGDDILVLPGTYTEHVVIPAIDLAIVGSGGPSSTVVDGTNTGGAFELAAGGTLTIQGICMTAGAPAAVTAGAASNLTLGNTVIDMSQDGVQLGNGANLDIDSSSISNCSGTGIASTSTAASYQVQMHDTTIVMMSGAGIAGAYVSILGSNSTISDCGSSGIQIMQGMVSLDHWTILRCNTGISGDVSTYATCCTISDCVGSGMALGGVDSPTVQMSSCTVSGNGGTGLGGYYHAILGGCNFDNNNGPGAIGGGGSGSLYAAGCTFDGNGGLGLANYSDGTEITACSFSNNSMSGLTTYLNYGFVTSCTLNNNGGHGLEAMLTYWPGVNVSGITANGNAGHGVTIYGTYVPISLADIVCEGNGAWGMSCDGAGFVAERVTAQTNQAGGARFVAQDPAAYISLQGAKIANNQGEGLRFNDGDVHLHSALVHGNTGSGITMAGHTAEIGFSTLHGNGASAIEVVSPALVVHNSLLTSTTMPVTLLSGAIELVACLTENPLVPIPGLSASCHMVDSPQYVDPVTGDFHLMPSSPAMDAGVASHPLITSIPSQDLDGMPRIQGLAPDLGAYEGNAGTRRVCLTGSNPAVLGQIWHLEVRSGVPNAPLFVMADVATGSTPLAPGLISQLAFSPFLTAVTAPAWSPWGQGFGIPQTDANGDWALDIPIPVDFPALPLGIWLEAFVLDGVAPNGLAWQSNVLPVTFSIGAPSPVGFNVAISSTGIQGWNRTAGIGDVNQDGIPDLATTSAIWQGDGAGGFLSQPFGLDPDGIEVALADFNNDGFLDLLTMDAPTNPFSGAATADQAMVFIGDGSGQYVGAPSIIPLGAWDEGAVLPADLNGDGYLDVVVAAGLRASGPGLRVFLNSGGVMPSFVASGPGLLSGCRAVAAGDLNGDGLLDLICEHSPNNGATPSLLLLPGNGSGQFNLASSLAISAAPEPGASYLATKDFNGDGVLEIVWASRDQYGVLEGSGASWTYHAAGLLGTSLLPSTREATVEILDLNNDGYLDLVAPLIGGSFAGISVALSDGGLGFPHRFHLELPSMTNAMFVESADLDLDGDADLVVGGSDATVILNNN